MRWVFPFVVFFFCAGTAGLCMASKIEFREPFALVFSLASVTLPILMAIDGRRQ
jgi:hypothetical protein